MYFPIAFGLCEVESTYSWEWFLATLKDDLNISNSSPYTIMSDKQKVSTCYLFNLLHGNHLLTILTHQMTFLFQGLIAAVQKVFPYAEHRHCVRHIYQNFHKIHKGDQLKNDLWAIARSTHEIAYSKNMEQMKEHSLAAYKWVEKLAPKTWIKAFFPLSANVISF